MTLGASGDGKTCLIGRLIGEGFTPRHNVTNGLETDLRCKVKIVRCNQAWERYTGSQAELLDQGLYKSISENLRLHDKVDTGTGKSSAVIDHHTVIQHSAAKPAIGMPNYQEESTLTRQDQFKPTIIFHEQVTDETERHLKQAQHQEPEKRTDDACVIHIWDFAGQVMYYILHQIFLRWRCVYILVINLSRDLHSTLPSHQMPYHKQRTKMKYWEQIEFWLNMIMSHLRKTNDNKDPNNILIVGTHKDLLAGNTKEQERKAQKYYSELESLLINRAHLKLIKTFIAVDSKGGDPKNYAKLRGCLMEAIQEHCRWDEHRPIRWLRLEKKLHERTDANFVTVRELDKWLVEYDIVKRYAEQMNIHTEDDLKTFLEFHHLTADITYCSGDVLGKYIVPDPQWIIDVFRSLIALDQFLPKERKYQQEVHKLRKQAIIETKGHLLDQVWRDFIQDELPANAKHYLLSIMVHFDLAVMLSVTEYLIPCMLPMATSEQLKQQSYLQLCPSLYIKFHSSKDSNEAFIRGDMTYDNFLPHGLFQKLMSKCSKSGWKWIGNKYQDSVTFTIDGIIVSLQSRSTWIKVDVYNPGGTQQVIFAKYLTTILDGINNLSNLYHPNMWYELDVNSCSAIERKDIEDCLSCIGRTSLDMEAKLTPAFCSRHLDRVTPVKEFSVWFSSEMQGKF